MLTVSQAIKHLQKIAETNPDAILVRGVYKGDPPLWYAVKFGDDAREAYTLPCNHDDIWYVIGEGEERILTVLDVRPEEHIKFRRENK